MKPTHIHVQDNIYKTHHYDDNIYNYPQRKLALFYLHVARNEDVHVHDVLELGALVDNDEPSALGDDERLHEMHVQDEVLHWDDQT